VEQYFTISITDMPSNSFNFLLNLRILYRIMIKRLENFVRSDETYSAAFCFRNVDINTLTIKTRRSCWK